MTREHVAVAAPQAPKPSNDDGPGCIARLDLGLILAVFGLVAVTFGQMTYTLATGPDDVVSVLRR